MMRSWSNKYDCNCWLKKWLRAQGVTGQWTLPRTQEDLRLSIQEPSTRNCKISKLTFYPSPKLTVSCSVPSLFMISTHIIAEVLLLHLYSAELEAALSPTFLHTNQLTCQQRSSLDRALGSINSWFDIFFTITPAAYIEFPFSVFSQLIRCLITIYRLTTLDGPSWEKNGVLKTVDPLLIIHRVINNLEQVAILAGLDNSDSPERDAFSRAAQMFDALRLGWETNWHRVTS